MKKIFLTFLCLGLLIMTSFFNYTSPEINAKGDEIDYSAAIGIAKAELNNLFGKNESVEIDEITTMARAEDNGNFVVSIEYSMDNREGKYSFVFQKDANGNYEILKQGEDIDLENLWK